MNELVRAQLLAWVRRYRGVGFGLLAVVVLVATFPSVVPSVDGIVRDGFASVAPDTTDPTTSTEPAVVDPPSTAEVPVPSITTTTDAVDEAAPIDQAPRRTGPAIAPPPPAPEPTTTVCPLDLPRESAGTEPLPLADVLNLISPALPLLGPFVPFALAGSPVVEPVLPVVTPLLPVAAPVYVHLGPVVGDLAAPLVQFEAVLLMPIEEPLATYTPQMLEAEQDFIDQLQPLLDAAADTGLPDCGAIVTASLGSALVDLEDRLGIDALLEKILGLLG